MMENIENRSEKGQKPLISLWAVNNMYWSGITMISIHKFLFVHC